MNDALRDGPLTKEELYEMRDLRWINRGLGFGPARIEQPERLAELERRFIAHGAAAPTTPTRKASVQPDKPNRGER